MEAIFVAVFTVVIRLFLTFGALAVEGVDLVNALAIVETRLAGTLICVDVAEHTLISWNGSYRSGHVSFLTTK